MLSNLPIPKSSDLQRPSSKWVMPILMLSNTALLVILALLNIGHLYSFKSIREQRSTFVQTLDGDALLATPVDATFRSDALILGAVNDWLVGSLTWNGTYDGESDEGVLLASDRNIRVPTDVYHLQQFLSPNLREGFLRSLSAAIDSRRVLEGSIDAYLELQFISTPERHEDSSISVNVVAEWIVNDYSRDRVAPTRTTIPFNRTIVLRPIVPPRSLQSDLTLAQSLAFNMQKNGLQVISIQDLTDG